ncbi:L-threonylcarbamoyladenylate synthase [Enterococcus timonensis]|uniref:L-threonylcarbamoyladenylate synthase n=1 Tax=Enterococcus timonensis TaxID=1852364 RepID=UPI0008D93CC9|nr:L-threonylcarbamoyladenylate synthase [Enterococcus timonensis]
METKILTKNDLDQAVSFIQAGELVAFPTETVYGLGADCENEQAVAKVFAAKGRPSDNPLIVTVASLSQIEKYVGKLPANFKKLAEKFWPGPLTMILPILPDALSPLVTGGLKTCAFRMPDNALTLELIKKSNRALVGPSANTSGKPSPTSAEHVYHDLKGKIAGILDDGPTTFGVESTVLDLSSAPLILRPGSITAEQLSDALGVDVSLDQHLVGKSETPKAPGMKYKHYSPNAEVVMMPVNAHVEVWQRALLDFPGKKIGLLAPDHILQKLVSEKFTDSFSLGEDHPASFNHFLFAGLRALDESCEVILAATLSGEGAGAAYMNRLKKASGNVWCQRNNS